MAKIYASREFEFEAAHHLVNYEGACANVHGHTYKLQVTVSGFIGTPACSKNAVELMVMDFKDLKKIVKQHIIDTHDHKDLNTLYENPTAEFMAVMMYHKLKNALPRGVMLESIKLWETSNSFVEYRGE